MKKILSLLFVFTLVACGGSDDGLEDSDNFFDNHRGKVWVDDDNFFSLEGNGDEGTILWRYFSLDETPNCGTYFVGDNIVIGFTCYNNKTVITSNSSNRLEYTTQFFEGDVVDGECVGLIDVENVGPRLITITVNGNQLTFSSDAGVFAFNLIEEDIPSCFD